MDDERVTQRIVALTVTGKIEKAGNVLKWRFSEIRLPAAANDPPS